MALGPPRSQDISRNENKARRIGEPVPDGQTGEVGATPAALIEVIPEVNRHEGWTARQVVDHLADEHINGFTYFKMAITEDEPIIKTYNEPRWTETEEAGAAPIELSVNLLTALHARWVILLNSLDEKGFHAVTFTGVAEYPLMAAFSFMPGMACVTRLTSRGCGSVRGGDFQRR